MRPEKFLNTFVIKVGRGWSEKHSWLGEMIHKMILLVLRQTLTGWRNEPQESHVIQQRERPSRAPGEKELGLKADLQERTRGSLWTMK